MSKYIQIRALKDLGKAKEQEVVKVLADENGIPFSAFWRKRLKDAELDNCCELIIENEVKPKQPKKATKKSTD